MSSGVLSGLQNLYKGLRASWVGSIPTHPRQFDFNCSGFLRTRKKCRGIFIERILIVIFTKSEK